MDNEPKQTDRAGVIAPPPLIYALFFGFGYGLNLLVPANEFALEIMRPIGIAIALTSLILVVAGLVTMKRAGTNVDPSKATTSIVTAGPFRFSRNPLYLSLTLLYIGAALYIPLLWTLATLPFALVVLQRGVIWREERYLEKKFGAEYMQYKNSTPRWLF